MINTIIFDLDGTLVDTESNWFKTIRSMVNDTGNELTLDAYIEVYMGKTIEDNVRTIINKYKTSYSIDEGIKIMISRESKMLEDGVNLKKGATELLDYLHHNNYKIVIGTLSVKDRVLKILQNNKIEHYFDDIVVRYDVEKGKPFPDIFLAAAAKVNSKPEECLVLEDSEVGIEAAHEAGMKSIYIPDLKELSAKNREKTECILSSLSDVVDYLEQRR